MQYASQGYSVMPVGRDKRPLLSAWKQYQEVAATEEQIEKWWTKKPDVNIAIITGNVSGIIVIDVDTYAGAKDIFPDTFTVQTGNGGVQKYYQYAPGFTVSANGYPSMPHVDIRSDGGYVVAAPSVTNYLKDGKKAGGQYSIINDAVLAPFPSELFAPSPVQKTPNVNSLLAKGFPTMAEGDGRNNALTKVVGKLLKVVKTSEHESVGWPLTLAVNARFKKPLDEKEARIVFNSIAKKEQKKPLSQVEFLRTDKGVIIANVENVYRTIQADETLRGHFRINTFAGSLETNFQHAWEPYQKVDIIHVQRHLMSTYPHFTRVPYEMVESAVISEAEKNRVSPPKQWLESLVWDQTPRLDTWLTSTYHVEPGAYHKAVGANVMKGLVKRLVQPGSKFDYVMVLEGAQGIRKSTSLAILGGGWHVETVFSPDNKDFFMLFAGNALVEFAEGETLSRTEAKKLKAVITMTHDKYRPPYDRNVRDFPRQCIFVMTTNQDNYLKDDTGNRRWLPVAVKGMIDTDWLEANREQLYAEAYHRAIVLKESTHEFPAEETAYEQSLRQTVDPWEEIIFEWYYTVLTDDQRANGITTRMAFLGGINNGFGGGPAMDRSDETKLGNILSNAMRLDRRRSSVKGTRVYLYYPSILSEKEKPNTTVNGKPVNTSIDNF